VDKQPEFGATKVQATKGTLSVPQTYPFARSSAQYRGRGIVTSKVFYVATAVPKACWA
jgi:hypothetical protein